MQQHRHNRDLWNWGGGVTYKRMGGNTRTICYSGSMFHIGYILGSRFFGKQCFVVVDIEGAELLMLEGGISFIKRDPKPIWMVEISITELQPKGIRINPHLLATFQFFLNNGYEAWTADQNCRPILSEEIECIIKNEIDTLYIHNFLFIEQGKKNDFFN
jgi:hypothetical protein